MDSLERLTRRQIDALRAVAHAEEPNRGASLKSVSVALKVRPPSALGHLTALERFGLVARFRGKSRLTERGRGCLTDYERHHRVAEQLFARLGFSSQETCQAARQIDLALDHRMVERICRAEGHPARCPHGDPIPPCGRPNSHS